MFKHLLFSFLAIAIVFLSVAPTAAQAQWYNQSPGEFYSQVHDDSNPSEIFGERYTAAQVDWILMSLFTWPMTKLSPKLTTCFLTAVPVEAVSGSSGINIDITLCLEGLNELYGSVVPFSEAENSKPLAENKGILKLIFEDREFSGVNYLKTQINRFNIVPEANAQTTGFGYSAFGGMIRELWQQTRNVAYALSIVFVIILAFMIMFRVKTSPQTIITVQSALPKLAITLVLITFSYAIAGFMVDLMYIVIGILSIIFADILNNGLPGIFIRGDEISDTFYFFTQGPLGTGAFGFLVFDAIAYPITLILALLALPAGWGNLTLVPAFFVFLWANPLVNTIVMLLWYVLLILLVFILLRIIFMLFKALAMLFVLVIFAPFYLLFGLVSNSLGFWTWIREILANLAVFPVTGVFFALSYLFLAQAFNAAMSELGILSDIVNVIAPADREFNSPVEIGDGWPPLLGAAGDPAALILLGVSHIFLFLTPKAADIVKSFISGRPISFGSAAAETFALGGITGMAMKPVAGAAGTAIYGRVGSMVSTARETTRARRNPRHPGNIGG